MNSEIICKDQISIYDKRRTNRNIVTLIPGLGLFRFPTDVKIPHSQIENWRIGGLDLKSRE